MIDNDKNNLYNDDDGDDDSDDDSDDGDDGGDDNNNDNDFDRKIRYNLKKKTFELRKFIKTREMATDHEITTLNLMSDVGILGIDTRNSFANCYYSLSR